MKSICHLLLPTLLAAATLCGCRGNFNDRLREEAHQYTQKHCPQQLDGVTRLDSVAYDVASRTYTSFMTVPADVATVAKSKPSVVKSTLIRALKDDVRWKECKSQGINFCYVYYIEGETLPALSVTLTQADYTTETPRKAAK